jgi:hypothetical protein
LIDLDPCGKRVQSDGASGIHANQVSLNRGISRGVELNAADNDSGGCRVDYVAGAGCGATNRGPGS